MGRSARGRTLLSIAFARLRESAADRPCVQAEALRGNWTRQLAQQYHANAFGNELRFGQHAIDGGRTIHGGGAACFLSQKFFAELVRGRRFRDKLLARILCQQISDSAPNNQLDLVSTTSRIQKHTILF